MSDGKGALHGSSQPLISDYQLELFSPPCLPGAATWSEREHCEPLYEKHTAANLMQIYRLLPRTNCGECGCGTCMAFAADL